MQAQTTAVRNSDPSPPACLPEVLGRDFRSAHLIVMTYLDLWFSPASQEQVELHQCSDKNLCSEDCKKVNQIVVLPLVMRSTVLRLCRILHVPYDID